MQHHARALGALVVTGMLGTASLATAQPVPPLTYAQPLSQAAVQAVQARLREMGTYGGRVDGVWGPDSQLALQNFQQTHGLQTTGTLNQATVATLGMHVADLVPSTTAAPAVVAAAEPLSPTMVRTVQSRLQQLGFYTGTIDGVWGAGTQEAISRFQQGRGIQANGQLNPITLTTMGIDPTTGSVVRQ